MDDLISRQALCEYALNQKDKSVTPNDIMRFPSAQPVAKDINVPVKDCISRQAAIDALADYIHNVDKVYSTGHLSMSDCEDAARSVIEGLPSAQPEVIRCTECKHYREYDSEYVENAVVVQCMADRYPISETIPDGWFCAGAERKDDE